MFFSCSFELQAPAEKSCLKFCLVTFQCDEITANPKQCWLKNTSFDKHVMRLKAYFYVAARSAEHNSAWLLGGASLEAQEAGTHLKAAEFS